MIELLLNVVFRHADTVLELPITTIWRATLGTLNCTLENVQDSIAPTAAVMLLLRVRTLPEMLETSVLDGMPLAAEIGDDATIPLVFETSSVVAVRTSQFERLKEEKAGIFAGSDPVKVLPSNEQFWTVPPFDDRFEDVESAWSPFAMILQLSMSQFECTPEAGLVIDIAAASVVVRPSKPVTVMSFICQPVVAIFITWTVAGNVEPEKWLAIVTVTPVLAGLKVRVVLVPTCVVGELSVTTRVELLYAETVADTPVPVTFIPTATAVILGRVTVLTPLEYEQPVLAMTPVDEDAIDNLN